MNDNSTPSNCRCASWNAPSTYGLHHPACPLFESGVTAQADKRDEIGVLLSLCQRILDDQIEVPGNRGEGTYVAYYDILVAIKREIRSALASLSAAAKEET